MNKNFACCSGTVPQRAHGGLGDNVSNDSLVDSAMIKAISTTFAAGPMLALFIGSIASMAEAHDGANGVTKERMDLMKGMADAMKSMGPMFKGEAPLDHDVVAEKAHHLSNHAKEIPELTPEGSNEHPSDALPIIWEDWDGYVENAEALAEEGAKLVEIAENGANLDEARTQFAEVGKTCSTCHDTFRKPKD